MFEGLLQPAHLVLILAITLLVFGPGRLGEIGSGLGRGIREFKRGLVEDTAPRREVADPAGPAGVPRGEGTPDRSGPAAG